MNSLCQNCQKVFHFTHIPTHDSVFFFLFSVFFFFSSFDLHQKCSKTKKKQKNETWTNMNTYSTVQSTHNNQVYIVGHMPPGSDERQLGIQMNGHTTFSSENNLRYLQLVRKYSSIISGQFFGHLHSDSFRIIYSDNGKAHFPIYLFLILFFCFFFCWCCCRVSDGVCVCCSNFP